MYTQVFIIQCLQTHMFLMADMSFTPLFNKAAYCFDRQSALDTALAYLGNDFSIHEFYIKTIHLPYKEKMKG